MEEFNSVTTNILDSLTMNNRTLEGDEYVADDGLIYCKICNTPRQYIFKFDKARHFNKRCLCQEALLKKEREEKEREAKALKIEMVRDVCMNNITHKSSTFEKDDNLTPEVATVVKSYVNNFETLKSLGQGLLLWGGVGTGKTFFAMCVANALIDNGYRVKSTSLAEIVRMAQDFENAERHFGIMMKMSAIVIDDLGTERGSTFATEQVFKFIDNCNTKNIPLIITTNLTPTELENLAGSEKDLTFARIYSRILEKCYPLAVIKQNRRANNSAKNKKITADILNGKLRSCDEKHCAI